MRFRQSIGRKILIGFIALIFVFALNATYSIITLDRNDSIIKESSKVINPSLSKLNEFKIMVIQAKMLITNWVFLQSQSETNTADKEQLKALVTYDFFTLKDGIEELMPSWKDQEEKELMDSVLVSFRALLEIDRGIMNLLKDFDSYEDPIAKFQAEESIESEVLPRTEAILSKLEEIKVIKERETSEAEKSLMDSFDNLQQITVALGIAIIFIGLGLAFWLVRSITRPINYIKSVIAKLGRGELPEERKHKGAEATYASGKDEIGQMASAVDQLVLGLRATSEFAENIGKGNYDSEFTPLSDHDVLGTALLEMRDNLKKVSQEDSRRNWATEGIAKFGEILRKNNDNISRLSDEVISNLVKYMYSNQGGLFIVADDRDEGSGEDWMALSACYAWDKKKYLDQKVFKGEGLTGQAWMEANTIYVTDVPQDYVNITSGLGEANPKSLLIVPLKVNDEVYGVIEVASFNLFEDYQIEFVEKVAESIASTISSVRINERTQRLLEESTELTEQMRAQEEEMRQNVEELQATQEEMARSQRDREDKENIIDATNMYLELDTDFRIKNINRMVKLSLRYDPSDLQGKPLENIVANKDTLDELQNIVVHGRPWSGVLKMTTKNDDTVLVQVAAGKGRDGASDEDRYLLFAADITNTTVNQ